MLQLSVEGLTKAKLNIIEHLLQTHKPTVILLQETHIIESSRLKILDLSLATHTKCNTHGIATFIRNSAKWSSLATSPPDSRVEWAKTQIEGVTVINI